MVVPNVVDVEAIRFTEAGRRTRPGAARDPGGRVRGGLHLEVSPQEAQRRRGRCRPSPRRSARPSDHGRGEARPSRRCARRPARSAVAPTSCRRRRATWPRCMSAFDVSVFCPSPTEGAPRATILGMLAERPCLATGAEGVADLIRPEFGAITQPENDPEALAALLETYLADPALGPARVRPRADLGRAAVCPGGGRRADRRPTVARLNGWPLSGRALERLRRGTRSMRRRTAPVPPQAV